ncbi:MAG: Ig-like domain-containing protein [Lachnospiraceae bacterium]|nr:Ig-like domain-containing protein [Lachnospiraceae bacterium]
MKKSQIIIDIQWNLFKVYLLIPLMILLCIGSLITSVSSIAYSIPSKSVHDSFSTSYKISPGKSYSDNILSDSSNFYYIDLYNMKCNSKTSISLSFSGNNLNSLDYQVFKDNFTSMSYNFIFSNKKTNTISFPFKTDSERIYIAVNNTNQSKKLQYKLKLSVLKPQSSTSKSKKSSKKKKNTTKKTKTTKHPKSTKRPKSNKQPNNSKNKPKNNKYKPTVNTSKFKVKKIRLSKNFIRLPANSEYYLSYKILPANAKNKKVKWYSSNKKIVSVKSGRIYTHKKGIAIIRISSCSNKKVTASCTIKVI